MLGQVAVVDILGHQQIEAAAFQPEDFAAGAPRLGHVVHQPLEVELDIVAGILRPCSWLDIEIARNAVMAAIGQQVERLSGIGGAVDDALI